MIILFTWIENTEHCGEDRGGKDVEVALGVQALLLLVRDDLGPVEDVDVSVDRDDHRQGSVEGQEELGEAKSHQANTGQSFHRAVSN